jgi:hypothetical protein
MKKSRNPIRDRNLSWIPWTCCVWLPFAGFLLASGCDMGTYGKRYDGPGPKAAEPANVEEPEPAAP